MRLELMLKHTLSLFKDNDIILFAGTTIINTALPYKKDNYFYMEKAYSPVAFATGIAMCTDKRVFVICSSEVILKDLNAAPQAAVSECKNLIFIVIDSGIYDASDKRSTIFRSMRTVKNVFFGMGFVVYDYNIYYKNVATIKRVKAALKHVLGPLVILLETNKCKFKELKEVKNDIIKFSNTITDNSLGTSVFVGRPNG